MVQVTPFQGANPLRAVALGEEITGRREGRQLRERQLTQQQQQFDARQKEQMRLALPGVVAGIYDGIDALPTEARLDQFGRQFEAALPYLQSAVSAGVAPERLITALETTTAEELGRLDNTRLNRQLGLREREADVAEDKEQRQSTKLSSASEKALLEATDRAANAGRLRFEMEELARDFEANGDEIIAGVGGDAREAFNRVFGSQDGITQLRTRYTALRNSQAVKNLPPGVASDRDIALALEGFLPPSANATAMASFLRGMAKMNLYDEVYNEFAANYIDQNSGARGLLNAWKQSPELAQLQSQTRSEARGESRFRVVEEQ